jgi:hypothetical protein
MERHVPSAQDLQALHRFAALGCLASVYFSREFSLRTIAISSRRRWHAEAAIIVVIAAAAVAAAAAAEIGRRLANSVA